MSLNQEQLDLFECPICFNFMFSPIYQCPNGHVLCSTCKDALKDCCPTCKKQIGNIRALVLEKMARTIQFSCKYRDKGCLNSFRYELKRKHEGECRYRPYDCPLSSSHSCRVREDVEALVTHLVDDHGCYIVQDKRIDSYFSSGLLDMVEEKPIIYKCYSEYFILHFVDVPSPVDMVCIYLTFMGEEMDAMNFKHTLKVGDGSWAASWEGNSRSIREKASQDRRMLEGLILSRTVLVNLKTYPRVKGWISFREGCGSRRMIYYFGKLVHLVKTVYDAHFYFLKFPRYLFGKMWR